MKCVELKPSILNGIINVPPSKSLLHRAIIGACLADGKSHIKNIQLSKDITATIEGMKKLGSSININRNSLDIDGTDGLKNKLKEQYSIDCIESGSTLRFLIPLSIVKFNKVTFFGGGKLIERPLDIYYEIFNAQNIKYFNNDGKLPLTIEGRLKPGIFKVRGDISSQFITGLLYALPLLEEDSKIIMLTKLESKAYVDLTLDVLSKYGINIENNDYKEFIIKGAQRFKSRDYTIEGDYSQAAFFLAAALLGSNIVCSNLSFDSLQGDRVILKIIEAMGAEVSFYKNSSIKVKPSKTFGVNIDASECPDLVPILAVVGALSEGTTRIFNAERVRLKESDRLSAITVGLRKLGAEIEEKQDGLIIKGKQMLKGGTTYSFNDHRIAMALAVASTRCEEAVIIRDSECVEKSYPEFWDEFRKLGGYTHEFDVR